MLDRMLGLDHEPDPNCGSSIRQKAICGGCTRLHREDDILDRDPVLYQIGYGTNEFLVGAQRTESFHKRSKQKEPLIHAEKHEKIV